MYLWDTRGYYTHVFGKLARKCDTDKNPIPIIAGIDTCYVLICTIGLIGIYNGIYVCIYCVIEER